MPTCFNGWQLINGVWCQVYLVDFRNCGIGIYEFVQRSWNVNLDILTAIERINRTPFFMRYYP